MSRLPSLHPHRLGDLLILVSELVNRRQHSPQFYCVSGPLVLCNYRSRLLALDIMDGANHLDTGVSNNTVFHSAQRAACYHTSTAGQKFFAFPNASLGSQCNSSTESFRVAICVEI